MSLFHAIVAGVPSLSQEKQRLAKDKATESSFEATIRFGMSGDGTRTRLSNILSAIRMLEAPDVSVKAVNEKPERMNYVTLPWQMPLRLSVSELSNFLLLPYGEEELPGAPSLHPKHTLPPKWYKAPDSSSKNDRTFAVSIEPHPRNLSISPRDSLEHTILSGGTGSGKSTCMLSLILADIKSNRSVLVLDPKSDLITSVLERIPEERTEDVVVIDPSDPSPVGFNPLALTPGDDPAITTDAILAVFQELFAANYGIRTADVLTAALNTLARVPDTTLLSLIPLLTSNDYRMSIVSKVSDPIGLDTFWNHYEAMSPRERNTEIAPVLNKLRQISMRPGLRNVLGQTKPKFHLKDLFLKRKIVLVPLNRGLIGTESARLLGSLIVGMTWTLALKRASIPPEKRHLVSIFIDELQDYLSLPTSFSDALAQARGLGVGYTVAHQFRDQLPGDIKAGIDTNCRNKVYFRLEAPDAKEVAALASPALTSLDFMSLPRYEIFTTFNSSGRNVGWLRGKTLPPTEPVRLAVDVKARSSKKYGVPAEETETRLASLLTSASSSPSPEIVEAPIGRRKRSRSKKTAEDKASSDTDSDKNDAFIAGKSDTPRQDNATKVSFHSDTDKKGGTDGR